MIKEIVKSSIITKPKDKKLKETKSWSTNLLIRIFYKIKEALKQERKEWNIKEFIEGLKKEEQLFLNQNLKLEDSGYLTFLSSEKDSSPHEFKVPSPKHKKQLKKEMSLDEEEKKSNENMESIHHESEEQKL